MKTRWFVFATLACGGWLVVGCNSRESGTPPARQTPSPPFSAGPATPAGAQVGATSIEATPPGIANASPAVAPQASPIERARPGGKPSPARRPSATVTESAEEVATPRPAPVPSVPTAPSVAASASKVVDPGGPIAVAATRSGLTRIGAEKCKVCHKVQFASWAETAHARRTPPLDCESCHGPGSEYKALAIMKDPEKARAAGLVIPTAAFCANCHRSRWKEDMLRKAHAHKAPSAS